MNRLGFIRRDYARFCSVGNIAVTHELVVQQQNDCLFEHHIVMNLKGALFSMNFKILVQLFATNVSNQNQTVLVLPAGRISLGY